MSYRSLQLSKGRRGSIFILVVAILAVLALLMLTLTYATRMELRASRNFAEKIQSRISVVTGVPDFDPDDDDPVIIGFGANSTAATQADRALKRKPVMMTLTLNREDETDRKLTVGAIDDGTRESVMSEGAIASIGRETRRINEQREFQKDDLDENLLETDPTRFTEDERYTQAALYGNKLTLSHISDESAKINVNTIIPTVDNDDEEVLTRGDIQNLMKGPEPKTNLTDQEFAAFIELVLETRDVYLAISPLQLSRNMIKWTYGPDGLPGIARVDDNANSGRVLASVDNVDNDQDLVIDNLEEESLALDVDGVDNDRDGQIDESEESLESDGIDNDYDGEIDEEGEALDEYLEFSPDIRKYPHGDDRPFTDLSQLMNVDGMTAEVLEALRPHLTIFSVSQPAYFGEDTVAETGFRQVDPNTISAEDLYDLLSVEFVGLHPDIIGQFVVNLVDRRDADDVPSILQLGPSGVEYTGFEISPRINEVFPYTATYNTDPDADDGQFVEIINPHTRALTLTGWRLEGAGTVVYLNGTLPPEGLLVITDDYDESNDPDPEDTPGAGSLYDLFSQVAVGSKARLLEDASFDLPDNKGSLKLYNERGDLIDTFDYVDGEGVGASRRSFQRDDPTMRKSVYTSKDAKPATPFKPNRSAVEWNNQDRERLEIIEAFHNRPFRSPLEVLVVPASASASSETPEWQKELRGRVDSDGNPLAQGQLNFRAPTEDIRDEDESVVGMAGDNIGGASFDLRLVDLFMPGLPPVRETEIYKFAILDAARLTSELDPSVAAPADDTVFGLSRIEREYMARRDAPAALFGRININTAPAALIASLPGMELEFANRIAWLRQDWFGGLNEQAGTEPEAVAKTGQLDDAWFAPMPPMYEPRWTSLSSFLRDDELWGDQTTMYERIESMHRYSKLLTFYSLSYSVASANHVAPEGGINDDEKRKPTRAIARRLLTGDRGGVETVTFDYVPVKWRPKYDKDLVNAFEAPTPNLPDELDPMAEVERGRAEQTDAHMVRLQIHSERQRRLREADERLDEHQRSMQSRRVNQN